MKHIKITTPQWLEAEHNASLFCFPFYARTLLFRFPSFRRSILIFHEANPAWEITTAWRGDACVGSYRALKTHQVKAVSVCCGKDADASFKELLDLEIDRLPLSEETTEVEQTPFAVIAQPHKLPFRQKILCAYGAKKDVREYEITGSDFLVESSARFLADVYKLIPDKLMLPVPCWRVSIVDPSTREELNVLTRSDWSLSVIDESGGIQTLRRRENK